jgi:hypothetical protein
MASLVRRTRKETQTMKGLRLDNPNGLLPDAGEYGKNSSGEWFGMTPNGHLANLSAHAVIEHEDGTITVHPSISVKTPAGVELWHGFLRGGVWEACGHYWDEPALDSQNDKDLARRALDSE